MITSMRKMGVKGFSLVELMIVVAIIGILAAVAIPNFQRFQRKARQSEANALLGGIHGANAAFHGQWEYYATELDAIGFVPTGTLRYTAGWAANGNPTAVQLTAVGYTGAPLAGTLFNTNVTCLAYPMQCNTPAAQPVTNSVAPANMGNDATFTAAANGDIGGAMIDNWTINQLKQMMNLTDGTL